MKSCFVEKSADSAEITAQQMEKINRYTRRALAAGEVFVFSVILCDNAVDRDGERFPKASLDKLAELFLGKTGIFDHTAKAEHQSARIFETLVETVPGQESEGEPYCRLKAWAYMVRCEKNADLILEIDAGIKKEVSVGCAVDKILCSVCGRDQKTEPCSHQKGQSYGGVICHHILTDPTDAYEWSFVAVPAQKAAGVTKGISTTASTGTLRKLKSAGESIVLSPAEAESLCALISSLEELARNGNEYLEELKREVVRLASISQPELSPELLEKVCGKMELAELKELRRGFGASASRFAAPRPQLVPAVEKSSADSQFKTQEVYLI